jgi:hypothetical protein
VPDTPLITYLALVMAVVILVVHQFVPDRTAATFRRQLAAQPSKEPSSPAGSGLSRDMISLTGAYQIRLIVGAALIEGVTFFLLIAYLLEGQWVSLLVAVLGLLLLAAKFPTTTRVTSWLESQQELLQYERGLQ